MILVAPNVLDDISRRADELSQAPSMRATRDLPGYQAYENALLSRLLPLTTSVPTELEGDLIGVSPDPLPEKD